MLSDEDNAEISKLDPALPVKLQTQSFDPVPRNFRIAGDTEVLDQTDLAAIATMPADNITLLKLIAFWRNPINSFRPYRYQALSRALEMLHLTL